MEDTGDSYARLEAEIDALRKSDATYAKLGCHAFQNFESVAMSLSDGHNNDQNLSMLGF